MKCKQMFYWNSIAFFMIQQMLAIWSLVPVTFLNLAWTSGSSQFKYCWSLTKDFELDLTSMGNEHNCPVVWTFFSTALLWDWGKHWPFLVLWPLLDFPNLLTYWVRTFTASSFRIWNSSAGIPPLPLALLIVMLPEVHLISHFGMSGSRWVRTPSWLSGSLRPFFV